MRTFRYVKHALLSTSGVDSSGWAMSRSALSTQNFFLDRSPFETGVALRQNHAGNSHNKKT